MEDVKKIQVVLAPGLEDMIRTLGVQMFGEDSKEEPLEQIVALLLPDLVQNALAGDMLPTQIDLEAEAADYHEDVRQRIEEAERKLETPDVQVPLEVAPEPEKKEDEVNLPTFEEITAGGMVLPEAVAWAKGHPGREAALVETCLNVTPSLWGIGKMLHLVERTYNMKLERDDI